MADTEKYDEESTWLTSFTKKSAFGKWLLYILAACLLLAASVYLFEAHKSLKSRAENCIKTNYANLPVLSGDDDLAAGIAAYNNKHYNEAVQVFINIASQDTLNKNAGKYLALSYLQQKEYDKALQQFNGISSPDRTEDFLKAITLLERNTSGDKEAAKSLLQKVVAEKKEESKNAEELLKNF